MEQTLFTLICSDVLKEFHLLEKLFFFSILTSVKCISLYKYVIVANWSICVNKEDNEDTLRLRGLK